MNNLHNLQETDQNGLETIQQNNSRFEYFNILQLSIHYITIILKRTIACLSITIMLKHAVALY